MEMVLPSSIAGKGYLNYTISTWNSCGKEIRAVEREIARFIVKSVENK
jgi:hypothetical protein